MEVNPTRRLAPSLLNELNKNGTNYFVQAKP